MNNFAVNILDPFKKNEQSLNLLNEKEVLDEFMKIPWYENIMEIFYSHNSESRNREERFVYNDYWCFSIETKHSGKKQLINIVPNYAIDSSFSKEDIRFSLEYMRPKKEKRSKLSRLFGGPQEKLNANYATNLIDNTIDETKEIINNFVEQDFYILEKKISTIGHIY